MGANTTTSTYFADVEIINSGTTDTTHWYLHPNVRTTRKANSPAILSYLHRDQLGSLVLVTNAAGGEDVERIFAPFGKQTEYVINMLAEEESYGFIGERLDAVAGLQYLNARYYDPEFGMFIQPDWLDVTLPGVGTNRYAYSGNDPINFSDPSGNLFAEIGAFFGELIDNSTTNPASNTHRDIGFNTGIALDVVLGTAIFNDQGILGANDTEASLPSEEYSPVFVPSTPIRNAEFYLGKVLAKELEKNYGDQTYHIFDPDDRRKTNEAVSTHIVSGGPARSVAGGGTDVRAIIGPMTPGGKGFEFTTNVKPSGVRSFSGGSVAAVWSDNHPLTFDIPGTNRIGIRATRVTPFW